jgi:hypothetical protein
MGTDRLGGRKRHAGSLTPVAPVGTSIIVGTASKKGGDLVIDGILNGSGNGATTAATWTVTKLPDTGGNAR